METRVALIGIIVESPDATGTLNEVLHEYGRYIIGRMGIPYHKREISLISIVVDAPQDIINSLTGRLGMIKGISAKAMFAKMPNEKVKNC